MTTICQGYQCSSANLINAHIFPRGFARDIMDGHKHAVKITPLKVGTTQHGIYDPNILCGECDNKIGAYDDYAIDISRRFAKEHIVLQDGTFKMNDVDGNMFAKFVLSVLWRASISSRSEFSKISLGVYEAKACEVIFGKTPLSHMPEYELLIGRYKSSNLNPTRNYTAPSSFKISELNGWGFALCGFRVLAKIELRRLPAALRSFIVNGNTMLRGAFINYEETTEGRSMVNMARAQYERALSFKVQAP